MPDAAPHISVVIPTYNSAAYLPEAIESALAQTLPPLEVIVVDDGSTDGTDVVAARFVGRVRWIRQENAGVSAARNRGIAESTGDWIAFLDADDTWLPTKLERQAACADQSHAAAVVSGLEYVDREGRELSEWTDGLPGALLEQVALLRPTAVGFGSTACVRRECFDRLGGFFEPLTNGEDWDMWRRIVGVFDVATVREPLVRYRQHADGSHLDVDRMARSMFIAFARMFADPAAASVHHLRRQAYARLHVMLAGSYAYRQRWFDAVRHLTRAVVVWPPIVVDVATRLGRRAGRPSVERRIADATRRG